MSNETMAIVRMGYRQEWVMPLNKAVQLLESFASVEYYESTYVSGEGDIEYIGGTMTKPEFKVELMTADAYNVAKLRGPKPEKEEE